jgi:hypothetical protein
MELDLAAAVAGGADAVELRLDFLEEWDEAGVVSLLKAVDAFGGEVIATYRIAAEGGRYDGDEATRVSRLEFVGLSRAIGQHTPEDRPGLRCERRQRPIPTPADPVAAQLREHAV